MIIGDEIEAFALVLQSDVLADCPEVIAQMQLAGRLNAAEDAFLVLCHWSFVVGHWQPYSSGNRSLPF